MITRLPTAVRPSTPETVDLKNEADVEQKFLYPVLTHQSFLGLDPNWIRPKTYMEPTDLDKGAGKKKGYLPDYSIWLRGFPLVVVEAKDPSVAPGFESCIAQMKNGEIESGFAELEFGKLLYINDVEFRFIDPRNRAKGEAYDYEMTYADGVTACADAKCKIESHDPTPTSIENTLNKARKQLPKDRPGIIFVKLQQDWFNKPETHALLGEVTRKFFLKTQRIVSVKYYVNQFDYLDDGILHTHRYREISNPRNSFDPTRTWQLFKPDDQQSTWNGLPSKWVRLINFEPRGDATIQ